MARFTEGPRDAIDATVVEWTQRCLLADGSLTQPDRMTTWSLANLTELNTRFNENPLVGEAGGGTFTGKWREQLAGGSDEVRLLAAEVMLVHFLFVSSVTKAGKLTVIEASLEGTGITLDPSSLPVRAMGQKIGHPGIGFNTRRDLQIGYLIDFALRFKDLPEDERTNLLSDPWKLRDFADDTKHTVREMRHVLLHLLRPDDFERISSASHKREIAAAFRGLLDDTVPQNLDEQLLAIHQRLASYLPGGNTSPQTEIDFYHPPLHGVWESSAGGEGEGAGDLETLRWKKQIILYGPPGTSKTYQARQLAETVIRQAALTSWGPRKFFDHLDLVEDLAKKNVHWVQLHPGYGYAEFVRGLRLEGDQTRYQPGLLPEVVAYAEAQSLPDDLTPLPVVLVLDEINRTDLSAMFGEAFSLLEAGQRGRPVTLPGVNPGEGFATLALPPDLYVIGTMNEIDQSVETLDFALRRRFLWRECPFERDTLLTIIDANWRRDVEGRFRYDEAVDQLIRFADHAAALNDVIDQSDELGRAYQVGHTYFADITFFLGRWLQGRKNRPANGTYLWTGNGKPQPPLVDLWDRSLKPLLQQYLAGSEIRNEQMRRLASAYFGK